MKKSEFKIFSQHKCYWKEYHLQAIDSKKYSNNQNERQQQTDEPLTLTNSLLHNIPHNTVLQ